MPDPIASTSDSELRAVVERALSSNYEIDREIGRGGMGIVYRAKDRRLKRTVAIKLLPPELAYRSEIRSRFLREAETAAQLSHPNIVPIYSVDERDGLVFFVMSLVTGDNLAKLLFTRKVLEPDEVRRIVREVAEALSYAHARGVVHRDIKPDNILLDAETGRAMVTDFGIARAVESADSRLTATGVAIGTPAYMSPEQAAGDREIDGRSDLYSLGIVAYQMLCGEPPFAASNTPTMLLKHISERPAPVEQRRPGVPADLASIVMTLLEKEPSRRFPNATSLVAALRGDVAAAPRSNDHGVSHYGSSAPEGGLSGGATHGGATHGGSLPPSWGTASGSALPSPYAGADTARPAPYGTRGELAGVGSYSSSDDLTRWSADAVQKFRRRFIYYAVVNSVILLASIFTGIDLVAVPVFWSIYIAVQYAGLWTSGYDWRDVFRQPRNRSLVDVASETVEEARSIFDRNRRPSRPALGGGQPPALPGPPPPASIPGGLGHYGDTVRRAESDRAEILRLVESLPKSDRGLLGDVVPSAQALFERIQGLAITLADLDRSHTPGAAADVESQIARLESEANPLDRAASEERVRRLALLKRQRRALADAGRKREQAMGKLESCVLALQNLRFDVLRLRAGSVASAAQHITTITERARALADEVDAVVYAADEIRKIGGRESGAGSRDVGRERR